MDGGMHRSAGPRVPASEEAVGQPYEFEFDEEGAGAPPPLRHALVESSRFPHVGIVRDCPVLRRIGRLRHLQYVETQAKRYKSAVLDRDCLIEPSDFSAVNIYASDASGITCAMRIGDVLDPHNPYRDLFLK